MFQERIEQAKTNLLRSGHDGDVQELGGRLLGVMGNSDDLLSSGSVYSDDSAPQAALTSSMQEALDGLRSALLGDDLAVLAWVEKFSDQFSDVLWSVAELGFSFDHRLQDFSRECDAIRSQSSLLQDKMAFAREQARIQNEAEASLQRTLSAEKKAKTSAGTTGGTSISAHFRRFATKQMIAAETFRVLTVAGVGAALYFAIKIGAIEPGDWTHLSYRIATVVALGALATYFARQAAQHRRLHIWARSLEVQLLSFPALIADLDDDERNEAYRLLTRRILSAPPEKGKESTEDSVGAAQLVDLATAIAKRT